MKMRTDELRTQLSLTVEHQNRAGFMFGGIDDPDVYVAAWVTGLGCSCGVVLTEGCGGGKALYTV